MIGELKVSEVEDGAKAAVGEWGSVKGAMEAGYEENYRIAGAEGLETVGHGVNDLIDGVGDPESFSMSVWSIAQSGMMKLARVLRQGVGVPNQWFHERALWTPCGLQEVRHEEMMM